MWPDTDFVTTRDTEPVTARPCDGAIRQDFPNQEAVDFYIAKANAMRARSFRRALARGWKAMSRFVRRQLSPCRRVKLPSSTA